MYIIYYQDLLEHGEQYDLYSKTIQFNIIENDEDNQNYTSTDLDFDISKKTFLNKTNNYVDVGTFINQHITCPTVEPCYNKILGTMNITCSLLFQTSHYIKVIKQ